MKKSLRRILALFAALFVALAAGMTAAQAATNFGNAPQGAHYAQGSSEPVCTLSGLTVTCTGTQIAGVGNTNATVTLAVTSTFTGVCHNPGVNSKIVEPFTESETTTTSSVITSTKNGRLVVPAQSATGTSTADFLADFTCPNPNWTPEVTGTAISFRYSLTFAGFTQPAILITG
ncbi:hypothetical protein ACJJV6_13005 [Arthrobacter nitrophenolicus]|uniref:hypothetical protein n=1 Tax=Arthrobacter nitrophenolicus TaxID=683150 RepID=UPI00389A0CB9